ncbi:MAG: potassium channel family protein [Nitrososphaerales archaeon]
MGQKRIGRLKYRPVNVKETITQIKDTAELMLDLAYSSLLFKEKDFGEEVLELEAKMNELIFQSRVSVMLAARGMDEVQGLTGVLQVIDSAVEISDGGVELAKIQVADVGLPPSFLQTLHLLEETIASTVVPEGSKAAKTSVKKIEQETMMRVIAIKKSAGEWLINPLEAAAVSAKDKVIVKGPFQALEEFEVFVKGMHEVFPSLEEMRQPKILHEIREIIVEMMTLSQLSIDLAYSSVIFNSREIANEVASIEDNLEVLRGDLEVRVLEYAKTAKEVRELRGLLRIASASEKLSDASKDISDIVLGGVGIHPILLYAVKESDEMITRVEIGRKSELDGKTYGESDIEVKTGMDIIALKPKAGKWQFHPKGDVNLDAGDIIIAKGLREGEAKLHRMVRAKGR